MSSASSSCDRFRARLESTMLGPLSPPAASAPWHGAQRASNCFLPASIRSARGGCCAAAQIRAQHTIRIVLIALATPLAYVALPRGETEPDLTAKTRRAQRAAENFARSEERRVGKEGRVRGVQRQNKQKESKRD